MSKPARKRAGTATASKPPPNKKQVQRSSSDGPEKPSKSQKGKKNSASDTPGGGEPAAPTLDDDGIELVEDQASKSKGGRQGKKGGGKSGKAGAAGEVPDAKRLLRGIDDRIDDWTAPIYAFYDPRPKVFVKGTRVAHVFKCLAPRCKLTDGVRRWQDTGDRSSTSGLKRHAESCWGVEAVRAVSEAEDVDVGREQVVGSILRTGSITAHFARKKGQVSYSHRQHTKTETRTEIVRWVCENVRPFKIVRDRGFLVLMKTGRPGYFLPSPATVSRDVKTVFARTRRRIAKMLQEYDGALSFATDAWSSPNHRAFVAVTVHFERNGEPMCLLLDVVEVARSHSGAELAVAFASILKEFGIENKCLAVASDNATNNDKMMEELERTANLGLTFDGQAARVRCFLHILNLVAKSLLKPFDAKKKAARRGSDSADDNDAELLAKLAEELSGYDEPELAQDITVGEDAGDEEDPEDEDDPEDEVDAMADLSDEEREAFDRDVLPVRLAIAKIRTVAFKIIHSTTKLLPRWKDLCQELGMDVKLLPRDVRTRWNSTYEMVEFALRYRRVVDKFCGHKPNGLREYELTAAEWTILKQLRNILKVFKHATQFFSRGTPNLAKVIPAMDYVDKVLTTAQVDDKEKQYDSPIRVACGLAKKVLNKYYAFTDMSPAYRIAILLHPGLKTAYFKRMRWPEAWQRVARELLVETYKEKYAGRFDGSQDDRSDGDDPDESKSAPPPSRSPSRTHSSARSGDDDGDDDDDDDDIEMQDSNNLDEDEGEGDGDIDEEMAGYAAGSASGSEDDENIFDVLEPLGPGHGRSLGDEVERYLTLPPEHAPDPLQWWVAQRQLYPNLSRMALDYLSIPASSVDVERVFSRGRLLLSHVRNRMSAQTTRAVLCVGNWSLAGFVEAEDARKVAELPEVDDNDADDYEMDVGWDRIRHDSVDK